MARQNDRNVGRAAQRVAATSALTVIVFGAALASAETASASTTQANVFWKELDRIEDTNGNGALGDPGDTAYWNFYGGGINAADTGRFTIDDPMIFGDDGFTIDSETIRPGVDTVHRLDDARAELEAEAGEVLGDIPPRPERSDYESTDDHGETVLDDELFIQDTEMYHQAVAEHSEYVAAGIAHSETFQDHGFRWAVAPEALGEQGPIFSHEISLPSYVARMQFEHVIRQDDITVNEDGSCTLVSAATSNYGATDLGVARDASTGEQINDFPVEDGYAAVQTVTAVDCAPEVAAPEPTPSQTPNSEPEVPAEKDTDPQQMKVHLQASLPMRTSRNL